MKRVLTGIWILFLILFLCLLTSYISNEVMISKFESGKYEGNQLSVLAFTETYIKHYNQGNIYHKNKEYEKALEEFRKALELNPPFDRICKIRINMALSMVIPINPEEVTDKNLKEVIQTLEEAQDILTEHGCALEGDQDGHHADAQQLYEEIEKFKQELLNESELQNNNDDDEEEEPQESEIDNAEEKLEQLEELQNQGEKERQTEFEKIDAVYDFEYYEGDKW